MTTIDTLTERNAEFAATHFAAGLRMMPKLKTILLGCVDPRVDPTELFGIEPGGLAAIRNVGGRVTPGVIHELAMLRKVTQAAGGDLDEGWDLVVLQHTDCGITRLAKETALLATFLGVEESAVAGQAILDPRAAVKIDVARLQADPRVPAKCRVSGWVYDVATGKTEIVVAPSPVRD